MLTGTVLPVIILDFQIGCEAYKSNYTNLRRENYTVLNSDSLEFVLPKYLVYSIQYQIWRQQDFASSEGWMWDDGGQMTDDR